MSVLSQVGKSVESLRKHFTLNLIRRLSWLCSKREHLINQIRAQAEQINKLISQLEAVQRSQGQPPNLENSSAILQSPTTEGDGIDEAGAFPNVSVFSEGNRVIETWLAQAKESFLQFENSIPKSYLSANYPDSTGWEGGEHVGSDELQGEGERYDIIETLEDNTVRDPDVERRHLLQGSNPSPIKRVPNDKAPDLPTEAAPWGLMGKLSLISSPNDQSPDNTGINSSTYFTSKQMHLGITVLAQLQTKASMNTLRTSNTLDHTS